ncbi:unnamed protein product [Symbiodinium natans]|uniref:DUF4116 domain-containing protein n=1 Tax=Symbiodinium natans TaxID=878477 RepID=A0A812J474_9DINO|nr:unnamed protein product [Symbiodinium natans]
MTDAEGPKAESPTSRVASSENLKLQVESPTSRVASSENLKLKVERRTSREDLVSKVLSQDLAVSRGVKEVEESLCQQIRELRRSLEHSIEVVTGTTVSQKQSLEVVNAKLRVVEQRTIRHTSELKAVMKTVEKHGLSEDGMTPLRQQLADMETRAKSTRDNIDRLHSHVHASVARLDDEFQRLDQSLSGDVIRMELSTLNSHVQDLRRDHSNFTLWARPVMEELLPMPSQVRNIGEELVVLGNRQARCEDDVNKITRLGRILDDKVEVFDDLQRRMEELNANAQRVLGSQFAASVRCLGCREPIVTEEDSWAQRCRTPSPPRPTVVGAHFEPATPKTTPRRRPQSAGARLGDSGGSEERFKSATGQEKLVLTVPRVRNDFYSYAKTVGKADPGGFTGAVRGVSMAALAATCHIRRLDSADKLKSCSPVILACDSEKRGAKTTAASGDSAEVDLALRLEYARACEMSRKISDAVPGRKEASRGWIAGGTWSGQTGPATAFFTDDLLLRPGENVHNIGQALLMHSPEGAVLILQAATSSQPQALPHALAEQLQDKEIVRTAVEGQGKVLVFVPVELRDDESIVQAAVAQDGLALEYASARLRGKCEIVLAALGQNPEALCYVLPATRDDTRLIEFGCSRHPDLVAMVGDRLRPMALKMALARLRMFVEPVLKEMQVLWDHARPIFRKVNSLRDLQVAIDDPKAFLSSLRGRSDDLGTEWRIAELRPKLECQTSERGLFWEDMEPVLKSCSRKEMQSAEEDGRRFLDVLQEKMRGETARLLAVAQLRVPLKRVLPKGMEWQDVLPALLKIDTLKELQNAREAPDLLLWKLTKAQDWPPAGSYSFAALRPKLEPKLEEGIYWEDFVKALQVLNPEELAQAALSVYRFVQLLEIYPMDPAGRWWFIARVRRHIQAALEVQGNPWDEAVEMMQDMEPAFDLQPAIHHPEKMVERLAPGPRHLEFQPFEEEPADREVAVKGEKPLMFGFRVQGLGEGVEAIAAEAEEPP